MPPKAPPKKPAKAPAKAPPKAPKRGTAVEKKGARKSVDSINWPAIDGVPMVQISFTASELIPTGDYANVTVGPVTATKFIPDNGPDDLTDQLNDLAELVEQSVSDQRELVVDSLQAAGS